VLFCSRWGKAKYYLFVVVELLETSNGGRGGGRGWKGSRGVCRKEQFENRSLYFEPANQTWFYFTNGVGLGGHEYSGAVRINWTKDLEKWDPKNRAVVLGGHNRSWSKTIIGLKRRTGRCV
jgi:hypothetical protein